ncbi:hypothetical protein [Rhizobium leguminosarum]|uniref:hypothetical protein n=1 Tax=Rhizobium leguminosarum TaxID=384 RepID=UPI003F9B9732
MFFSGPGIAQAYDFVGPSYWKFIGGWYFVVFVLARSASVSAKEFRLATLRSQEKLAENVGVPFTLLLRPFSSEGQIEVPSLSRPFTLLPIEKDAETIETQLARAVGDLRVVGGSDDIVGRVRVLSSDADWKSKFSRLAHASSNIFVLPAAGPGILWEINWLKDNGLLKKTMFLMPSDDMTSKDFDALWNDSCDQLYSATGLKFPKYRPLGSVFTIDLNGTTKIYDAKGFSVHAIRDITSIVSLDEKRPLVGLILAPTIGGACIAGVFAAAWALLGSDTYGIPALMLELMSPYIVAAGCFLIANSCIGTKFSNLQIIGVGTIWFIAILVWFALGGRGLTGHLDGLNGTFWQMLPIRNRVLINSLFLSSVVSLTLARFSYKSIATLTMRQAMRSPIVWVSASIVLALSAKLLPDDMPLDPEVVVWTGSAFVGGVIWLKVLSDARARGSNQPDTLVQPAESFDNPSVLKGTLR